jgi:drug/metabolite transporter (DMT)-like permease
MIIALLVTLASFIFYSAWGFINGFATESINGYSSAFYASFGYLIAGVIGITFVGFKPEFTLEGATYGVLMGITNGLGGLCLLVAIASISKINFPPSLLIVLAALYPLGTITLNYFVFNYSLTLVQLIGSIIAILGIIVMFLPITS